MNSSKLYIIVVVSFLIWSCTTSSNFKELRDNTTVNSIFNKSEIKEISKILDFFDSQICDNKDVGSKIKCYNDFIINVNDNIRNGKKFNSVPIEKQISMFKSISDSTFKNFWLIGVKVNTGSSDTLRWINMPVRGKYIRFLNELAKEDILVKNYLNFFNDIHDVGALIYPMTYDENVYNFKDIRIRLFVAIHYLTVNSMYNSYKIYENTDTIYAP